MRLIDADALIGALHNYAFLEGDDREITYSVIEKQPTVQEWISVDERLPEQHESIFAKYYGTDKWSKAMWRMSSELVIVAIRFKDGTGIVRTGDLRDGEWYTSVSRVLEPVVTHWMHFPKEPVGVKLNYA